MTFYLTDESQFVATYGPSGSISGGNYNTGLDSAVNRYVDHYHDHRGVPRKTRMNESPPHTRPEHTPYHRSPVLQPNGSYHSCSPSRYPMTTPTSATLTNTTKTPKSRHVSVDSFSDTFSYLDSICSSQSSDREIATTTVYRPAPQGTENIKPYQKAAHHSSSSTQASSSSIFAPNFLYPQNQLGQSQLQQLRRPAPPVRILEQQPPMPKDHHVLPKVTSAATPFQKMIAPSSYLYDELCKDAGYRHALQAGILWQSLCSQHVHFPSLWYDGDEPARPPMGCTRKANLRKHSIWHYLGRHRVVGDAKLNGLLSNRGSSGRLLLHIIVTGRTEAVADVCVGCFHPNARGIRLQTHFDLALENCRDIWIGYRQRDGPTSSKEHPNLSRIEALLKHYNKGWCDETPLGGAGSKQADLLQVDNENLNAVFGARPPLFTLFVPEHVIYDLLQRNVTAKCPASIVLMRNYLQEVELN